MFGAPLVASFIVGPFVDRWEKVKILRIVEIVKLCIVTLLLVSHLFFYPGAWLLFMAILIFSTATMFGGTAHTALLPRIVDSEDLVNANVLINIAGLAGGIGLGIVLIVLSTGELNFARFYGVITVLLFIAALCSLFFRYKEPAVLSDASKTPLNAYISELKEGLSFVKKGAIFFFTIAVMSMGFFADVAYVNLPMLVETRLGSAFSYMLLSFLALTGTLIGSFICNMIEARYKLWKILVVSFIVAGAARIVFVYLLADEFRTAIIAYLVYIGLASVIGIFYQIIIQKISPKNLLSRVDSAATSLNFIAGAVGALIGGFLGTLLYIDVVFYLQGIVYIAVGLLVCLSRDIRSLPLVSKIGENGEILEDIEVNESDKIGADNNADTVSAQEVNDD